MRASFLHRTILGGLPIAAAGALLLAAVVAAPARTAAAQAPLQPRDASSCRASLSVSPNVVLFGDPRPITVSATGLEPGVSYRLFFNNTLAASGSVDPGGAVQLSTTIEAEVAVLVNVQVVTESRCAAGTLVVAGPRRVTCQVLLIPGLPPFCG